MENHQKYSIKICWIFFFFGFSLSHSSGLLNVNSAINKQEIMPEIYVDYFYSSAGMLTTEHPNPSVDYKFTPIIALNLLLIFSFFSRGHQHYTNGWSLHWMFFDSFSQTFRNCDIAASLCNLTGGWHSFPTEELEQCDVTHSPFSSSVIM